MRIPLGFVVGAIPAVFAVFEPDTGCMLVQPSDTAICGRTGRFHAKNQIYQPQFVQSIEECAALCERRVYSPEYDQTNTNYGSYYSAYGFGFCQSFEFDTETNFCQLSNKTVEKYIRHNLPGKYVFYDSECYDCGKFCKQPYGENLLDNGGFEDKLLGPWASEFGTFGAGYKSNRSYLCDVSAKRTGCVLEQLFNICVGRLYLFQFDYRIAVPKNKSAIFGASIGDNSEIHKFSPSEFLSQSSFTFTGNKSQSWTTATGFYRALSSHEGPRFIFSNHAGRYYIDNARMLHVSEPTAVRRAQSLLTNGDFETGSLAPWTLQKQYPYYVNLKLVSPGINSQYALQLVTDFSDSNLLSQAGLATKPNTTYLLSFLTETNTTGLIVYASMGDAVSSFTQTRQLGTGITKTVLPFFAGTDSSVVSLYLSSYGPAYENVTVLLDEFKLVEAEPSPYY